MRLFINFLLCCLPALGLFGQKKDKNFNEGYVIRFSDTIRCKIYTGSKNVNIAHEVKFRYDDGRELTYNPGSVIKGFGYKTDTIEKHYYVIPVPEYKINKQRNNKAYAEVLANGYLKFLNYAYIEYILDSHGTTASKHNSYYLYRQGTDSCINIGSKPLLGAAYFTKEEISIFMSDYPALLSEIKEDQKIHIDEVISYINRYNEWFNKNRRQ